MSLEAFRGVAANNKKIKRTWDAGKQGQQTHSSFSEYPRAVNVISGIYKKKNTV